MDRYKGRRVLVTGATGFIGRHLVDELLNKGAQVRVLVRANTHVPAWQGKVEYCQGDLEDSASLAHACHRVEVVFHAAGFAHAWADSRARMADIHWRVNAKGTRCLLDAAVGARVARFVFLSSVKAMGEGGHRCVDEDWPLPPRTPYGRAKRAAEQWVIATGRRHGMHVVNLRLALVYGPTNKGHLEQMVNAIRRGRFPPLPEVGNKRSMVHVRDVVQAVLCAADHPAADRKTYIVTDGHAYSSRQLYDLICHGLGKPSPPWAMPVWVLHAVARVGDLMGWLRGRRVRFDSQAFDKLLGWACYRSDRIQRELGYRPSQTLADALPEMLGERPVKGKAH